MKTILSAVAFAALALPAAAQMANPMVGGAEMPATNDIVTNAMNSADHTTLVAAVQAAGLVETLQGAGPFTVLAPTNEAFAALPAGTVEALLEPQNKDRLAQILTCHVIPAEAFSSDIVGMIQADGGTHAIQTVGGCTLQASARNGMVMLTDEQGRTATVTIADVDQSNGVIHVIDKVLLPAVSAQQ
ncbi:fasciclin domain-containing protein [Rubellimicrobium arenae]|uniref:fasciclin domain-containing protein n=1 Tax=Rubellimicrobium arenae TaxID=2817372 RepID=UPI001B316411|nr:fasciclin domain-containing protein [Rubellimicrobium arenae]